jgi:RimJ/RimL family protein N-acetyltransferase
MAAFPPLDGPLSDGVVALRPWREDDAPAVVAMANDPESVRWTTVPSPYGAQDALAWFALSRGSWRSGERAAFAIAAAAGDELLGSIDLRRADPAATVGEIGYMVAPQARGRGTATRAVRLLSDWGFAECGLALIEILVQPGNDPSRRAAEAAGYRATGDALVRRPGRDGTTIDLTVLARSRGDTAT